MNAQKSIVVLPFENISSDTENEYFADGVTEEIILALGKVEGLKVTARTSSFAYKNNPKDIRIIGNELGVATALEGSIRKSGSRIRISAQLIRTDNGFQVWAESFRRDLVDIFELQDEISLLIADKIRENFGHLEIGEHLVTARTRNVDAYTLYLKGRYFQLRWNVEDFERAIQAYEESIRLDPEFFQPCFGLVQCYGLMSAWGFMDRTGAMEKANHYLKMGLRINDQTSEAHFALATRSLWVDWKPHEALRHLKRALATHPNDSESLESAAECHIALGQFDEAMGFIQKALEINPLSANHHFTQGNIQYLQKDFTNALACFDRSLKIDPSWDFSLQVSACCHVFLGDKEALDRLLRDHPDLRDGFMFPQLYEAIHFGKKIDLTGISVPGDVYFPWSLWTLIYAGKEREAFRRLASGVASKQGQYLNFQREPLNQPLRSLEGYRELAQSVFDSPPDEERGAESGRPVVLLADEVQDQHLARLGQLMQDEHCYTLESLSLRSLAERMDIHANRLSWLINERLGKNFNEYINGLRLEAFKRKALEPAYRNYSVLGLAFECGFNSKSVFNDFFKRSEGMTPSGWIKQQRSKGGSSN